MNPEPSAGENVIGFTGDATRISPLSSSTTTDGSTGSHDPETSVRTALWSNVARTVPRGVAVNDDCGLRVSSATTS
ncbi:hypothetical protein CPER28S_02121 [Cellulomonas persica]